MALKQFLLGFFAATVASLDDTATKVPVVSAVAKTRARKVAFAVGNLIALLFTIVIADFIASTIVGFPYANYVLAGIILLIAFAIRFDILVVREKRFSERKLQRLRAKRHASFMHFLGVGFFVTLVTLIDDTFAYLPLLTGAWTARVYAIGGILLSTLIQLYLLIYFSEVMQKLRYAKELSFYGLLVFAFLIFTGIV